MGFNFSGYFEFFEMIAKYETFQKIGKGMILHAQKLTCPLFSKNKYSEI